MPSGSYKQVLIGCPYYRYDDGKQRITCFGIMDDSSLALIFRNKADYETQINVFCCQHYKKCEVYRMLNEIYEED